MLTKLVLVGASVAPETSTVKPPRPSTRPVPMGMMMVVVGQGRVATGQLTVLVVTAAENHVVVPVTTQRFAPARKRPRVMVSTSCQPSTQRRRWRWG